MLRPVAPAAVEKSWWFRLCALADHVVVVGISGIPWLMVAAVRSLADEGSRQVAASVVVGGDGIDEEDGRKRKTTT